MAERDAHVPRAAQSGPGRRHGIEDGVRRAIADGMNVQIDPVLLQLEDQVAQRSL